jgi:hypothetical protein
MDIREFFTDKEIRSMKDRIVREACLLNFTVSEETTDEDGYKSKRHTLAPEIKQVIKEETNKLMQEYTRELIREIVKDKTTIAVEKFTQNLCDQLDKITAKTNWYWSVK